MLKIKSVAIERQETLIVQTGELSVASGEHVAVLGPNGAGKSSLLKVVCGEWAAAKGSVHFHDKNVLDWPRQTLARHLGVLPQASQVDFPFTVAEVTAIGATPLSLKRREKGEQVQFYLKLLDLLHLANQPYVRLSGGEKQRVQLARVLLQLSQAERAPLLLMDEPTSAQDLGHQHHLMQRVSHFCRDSNFGVVSVLHDLNIACRYSDNVWLINENCVQAVGRPTDVLSPKEVERHWDYLPEKIKGNSFGFGLL